MPTDDIVRDVERADYIKDKKLERRPKCWVCGDHIQEKTAILYEGHYYCKDCEDEFYDDAKHDYTVTIKEE